MDGRLQFFRMLGGDKPFSAPSSTNRCNRKKNSIGWLTGTSQSRPTGSNAS
jgi:hypothetical protein